MPRTRGNVGIAAKESRPKEWFHSGSLSFFSFYSFLSRCPFASFFEVRDAMRHKIGNLSLAGTRPDAYDWRMLGYYESVTVPPDGITFISLDDISRKRVYNSQDSAKSNFTCRSRDLFIFVRFALFIHLLVLFLNEVCLLYLPECTGTRGCLARTCKFCKV